MESCTLAAVTNREEEPERVGDDAPLPADDLLSGVDALASGGALVEASITQADGSASRPSFSRNSCLSRSLSWVNTPSAGARLGLPSADRAPRCAREGRGSTRHCVGFPLDLGLDHPTTNRPKRQGYSQDLHISTRGFRHAHVRCGFRCCRQRRSRSSHVLFAARRRGRSTRDDGLRGTPTPAAPAVPFADMNGYDVQVRAIAAMRGVKSFRMVGSFGQGPVRSELNLTMDSRGRCTGSLSTEGKGELQMIRTDKALYLKGDATWYREGVGKGRPQREVDNGVARLAGRWLKGRLGDPSMPTLTESCDMAKMLDSFKGSPRHTRAKREPWTVGRRLCCSARKAARRQHGTLLPEVGPTSSRLPPWARIPPRCSSSTSTSR